MPRQDDRGSLSCTESIYVWLEGIKYPRYTPGYETDAKLKGEMAYYDLRVRHSRNGSGAHFWEPYLGMSIPAAEQAAMTVDPLGMETELPLTVTSMSLLGAAAGCCDAEELAWNGLSASTLPHTGASREARRLCAASERRLRTMADLAGAMIPLRMRSHTLLYILHRMASVPRCLPSM